MKFWMAALAALGLAGLGEAQTVELYGQADTTWDARVAPDGRHVALGCAPQGRPAVCLYDLEGNERPKLFDPGEEFRLHDFYWAGDNYVVAEVALSDTWRTTSGNILVELQRAISFDIRDGSTSILMRNEGSWIDLTNTVALCDREPDKIVMEIAYRASADGPTTGSRLYATDEGIRTHLYDVNLGSGRSRARSDRNKSIFQSILDADCDPFVDVIYNDERGDFAIELVSERRTLIEYDDVDLMPMYVLGPTNDREHLIVRADHGDLVGLYKLALADGAMEPLTYQGVALGDLGLLRDRFTDAVYGFYGTDDIAEHFYIDEDLRALQDMVSAALPGQTVRIQSFNRDHTLFTLIAEMPGQPANYYLYDQALQEVSPLGAAAPQLANVPQASVTAISYTARDGLEIPGYLILPPGKSIEDGPFPTLLMPHGGPEARDTASFDWWAQAYAAEGYAVIKPNFRGSSGYGAAFRDAGFGEFGGAMVDDVVDAIAWAEAEGIADPRGVCAVGASYGGYSALMTGLKAPDKVGCIVAVAPVTDIFSHMSDYGRDTEGYRYWARYAGGGVFQDEADRVAISPAERTGDFSAEILLMHGKDDLVVRIEQSERFYRLWGNRSGLKFVELDGQDHYLRTAYARQSVLSESLALLAEHHPAR